MNSSFYHLPRKTTVTGWMNRTPDTFSGNRFPYYETVTADFVYLRLHGHEQLYASEYNETDLKLYAEKIISWLNEDKEVWEFFNNDYYGFAVKNAERLRGIV